MLLRDAWTLFETHVFPVPSTATLFNQYRDRHDALDRPDAPAVRRANLRGYLEAFEARPPVFLLLEAPGPWGCRFSGVPITSEAQLVDPAFPLSGTPSGLAEAPHAEYSAGIFWRVLRPYFPRFFMWGSVPLHPHPPGRPLAIRAPTGVEVAAFAPVVAGLLEVLRPRMVLAVGRKAEQSLRLAGAAGRYVRHPSQGGARLFEAGVRAAFDELGDFGF